VERGKHDTSDRAIEETQAMIFHARKVQADRKQTKNIISAVLGQTNQIVENFDNEFPDVIMVAA